MFAWINFAVLVFASLLFTVFYVRSAAPAGREKIIGPRSYKICFHERLVAGGLEALITANYILYFFSPSPILCRKNSPGRGGYPSSSPW